MTSGSSRNQRYFLRSIFLVLISSISFHLWPFCTNWLKEKKYGNRILSESLNSTSETEAYIGYAAHLISRNYISGYGGKVITNNYLREGGFLPCYPSEHHPFQEKTDMEYIITVVDKSHVYETPFRSSVYLCEILPWHLAHKIRRQFWPIQLLEPLKKKSTLGYTSQHMRWRKELDLLLTINTTNPELLKQLNLHPGSGIDEGFFDFKEAVEVFTYLQDILFSERFERKLFKKLGVAQRYKSKDFRIQIDRSDFSTGVHPDRIQKIATLQFYVPLKQQKRNAVWKYGTNLHTAQQFKSRNKKDGMASPYLKMLFLPNTAYAFKVHSLSYHSVSLYGGTEGDRLTFMLNWYSDEKSGTKKEAQKWQ